MQTNPHSHRRRLVLALICGSLAALTLAAFVHAAERPFDAGCVELLQNGGFEDSTAWIVNASAVPAAYVQYPVHSGQYAIRLGITEGPDHASYSSIQQQVSLPVTATSVILRFHVYPLTEAIAGDEQMLALLDPVSSEVIASPWRTRSSGDAWSQEVIDLTPYRGRSVILYFNVRNDGVAGRTAMYLDDVSLQSCPTITTTPTGTATSTHTPTTAPQPTSTPTAEASATPTTTPYVVTATPSPLPGPCHIQCLPNGDFEGYGAWQLGSTPLYPTYVAGRGPDGSRAMLLGNDGTQNVAAYSSIRQTVAVPAWPRNVLLRFWLWPQSEGNDAADRQELLLLHPYWPQVETELWGDIRNDRRWLQQVVDLTPYRGRSETIYFNVYNDGSGGRTAMYLDNVCLELCGALLPTPTATTAWPTRTPPVIYASPTPTYTFPSRTPTIVYPRHTATRRPTQTATSRPAETATPHPMHTATPTLGPPAARLTPTATATPHLLPGPGGGWTPLQWLLLMLALILLLFAVLALIIVLWRR